MLKRACRGLSLLGSPPQGPHRAAVLRALLMNPIEPEDPQQPDARRKALVGLVIVVLLIVVGCC